MQDRVHIRIRLGLMFRPVRYFARFIGFCASNFNEFLDKNGPYMSAAISFYALFSIFPLTLALVNIFYLFGIEDFNERLVDALVTQIPVLLDSGSVINTVLEGIARQRALSSVLAVLGLLWVSTAVFGSIRKSVNAIWGIKVTRSFLQERLMDFTLLFGASSILFASLYTTTLIGFLRQEHTIFFLGARASASTMSNIINGGVPLLITVSVFLLLYWWLPNTKLRFQDVAPTAILAAIAFEAAKYSFVFYLRYIGGPEQVYGAMGAVILMMAWVYVSAIIFLVGAQITARYTGWLARQEQHKRNEILARNLERVRTMPPPVPIGQPALPAPQPDARNSSAAASGVAAGGSK